MTVRELRTFADIYTAVLEELKVQSSDTTSLNRIKRDINMIYLDEVMDYKTWYWARAKIDLINQAYLTTGTVNITNNSNTVTFSSAPTASQAGKLFTINSYAEIYKIRSHVAGASTMTLESPFTGTTNATAPFKIWNDGIALPVECSETYRVWHDHYGTPMENVEDNKLLEIQLNNPNREGRPAYFRVTDFQDPTEFASISGLPALSTCASAGLIKTLVFATTVGAYISSGDRIQVSGAANEAYNGNFIVETVSTTTIQYIGTTELAQSATADASLAIGLVDDRKDNEMYRKLEVFPYLDTNNTTLHIEYIKKLQPLDNDTDEPAMPIQDRICLFYGACGKAWSRQRNPEEAKRNYDLFQNKLERMASKIQDSTDSIRLQVSPLYLSGKRVSRRFNWDNF